MAKEAILALFANEEWIMRSFLKNNVKKISIATVGILLAVLVIFGDDILAMILPNAADLQMISCEMEQSVFEYTGEEMKPVITRAEFRDEDGQVIALEGEEITVVAYRNNVDFGKGDAEVKLKGYIGTIVLEDIFQIQPARVEELVLVQVSEEAVELSWQAVTGAHGYRIFRSEDAGETYHLLSQMEDGTVTVYRDQAIEFNKIYLYQVCAFVSLPEDGAEEKVQETEQLTSSADHTSAEDVLEEETAVSTEQGVVTGEESGLLLGECSDVITCYTPLAVPEVTAVKGQDYQSLLVEWTAVDGAAGYQVYRSEKKDGDYAVVTESEDGSVSSYTDSGCKCGVNYYYYVKAVQKVEAEVIYGKASNTLSGRTAPNEVQLSGSTESSATEVTLSWKQSAGASGYEIYKKTGNGDYQLAKKIEDSTVLSWTETGLTKEKKYTYRIRPYCVADGTVVTGSYSNTYVKKAIVPVSSSTSGSAGSSTATVTGSIAGVTKYVGVPYVYGGTTPSGWDCSGFTQWVMKNYYGITIPRTAAEQGRGGKAVNVNDRSAWQPGDIICFAKNGRISHVGLYLGNNQMMHALNTKYNTFIQDVDYYENWDRGNSLKTVRRYH